MVAIISIMVFSWVAACCSTSFCPAIFWCSPCIGIDLIVIPGKTIEHAFFYVEIIEAVIHGQYFYLGHGPLCGWFWSCCLLWCWVFSSRSPHLPWHLPEAALFFSQPTPIVVIIIFIRIYLRQMGFYGDQKNHLFNFSTTTLVFSSVLGVPTWLPQYSPAIRPPAISNNTSSNFTIHLIFLQFLNSACAWAPL